MSLNPAAPVLNAVTLAADHDHDHDHEGHTHTPPGELASTTLWSGLVMVFALLAGVGLVVGARVLRRRAAHNRKPCPGCGLYYEADEAGACPSCGRKR